MINIQADELQVTRNEKRAAKNEWLLMTTKNSEANDNE